MDERTHVHLLVRGWLQYIDGRPRRWRCCWRSCPEEEATFWLEVTSAVSWTQAASGASWKEAAAPWPSWRRRRGLLDGSRSNFGEGKRIGRYGGRNRRYMALFSFFRLCAKIWHGGKLWKILGGNQARVVVLSLRFGAFTWVLGGLSFFIHTIVFQIKLCIHTI